MQQDAERKVSQMIMNKMDQIRNMEQQQKNINKELDSLKVKYKKLIDRDYLKELGKSSQNQEKEIELTRKDNVKLEKALK